MGVWVFESVPYLIHQDKNSQPMLLMANGHCTQIGANPQCMLEKWSYDGAGPRGIEPKNRTVLLNQSVTYRCFSQDVLGLRGFVFQFLAQMPHVYTQIMTVFRVSGTPYFAQ